MNNIETLEPNLLNSFIDIVRGYLNCENKKYPLLFTFNQKILAPKISKAPFNSILLACWFENHAGKDELYFKNDIAYHNKLSIRDLPFDRCIQIEVHEDYIEQIPNSSSFPNFEDFVLVLSKILNKEKSKIKLEFSSPVYIPELSLKPKKNFIILGQINPLSSDNGISWSNMICLFADEKTKIFYQSNIIPYQCCVNVTAQD